jgi:hypothetical protein
LHRIIFPHRDWESNRGTLVLNSRKTYRNKIKQTHCIPPYLQTPCANMVSCNGWSIWPSVSFCNTHDLEFWILSGHTIWSCKIQLIKIAIKNQMPGVSTGHLIVARVLLLKVRRLLSAVLQGKEIQRPVDVPVFNIGNLINNFNYTGANLKLTIGIAL